MSNHTPSPWKLDRPIRGTHAWISGGGQEEAFAKFFLGQPGCREKDPELVANFHLALAAPGLLDDINEIAALTTGFDSEEIISGIQAICARAIARTKGE